MCVSASVVLALTRPRLQRAHPDQYQDEFTFRFNRCPAGTRGLLSERLVGQTRNSTRCVRRIGWRHRNPKAGGRGIKRHMSLYRSGGHLWVWRGRRQCIMRPSPAKRMRRVYDDAFNGPQIAACAMAARSSVPPRNRAERQPLDPLRLVLRLPAADRRPPRSFPGRGQGWGGPPERRRAVMREEIVRGKWLTHHPRVP